MTNFAFDMTLRKYILQCGCVQLVFALLSFWFFNYSPVKVPEYIPGTPARINGLVLLVFMLATFIFFEKRFLRVEPEASIWELTSLAALSNLAAEIVFQLIRQFTYADSTPKDHLIEYLRSVFLLSTMSAILGFLIAYQLKTRKAGWMILFIVLALIVLNLLKNFFLK